MSRQVNPALQAQPPLDRAVVVTTYLSWGWMMVTLGSIMLLHGGDILPGGRTMSVSRAVFHAVSASTLTGFTTAAAGIEEFSSFGRSVMLALTGFGTLVWLALGGLAAKRLAGLKATDGMIWVATLGMVVVAALAGVIIPPHGTGSLVAMVGALANSGVQLGRVTPTEPLLHAVMVPLATVGGLGSVIVLDIFLLLTRKGHVLTSFTRATATALAAVFLFLTLSYLTMSGGEGNTLARAAALAATTMGYGLPVEFATGWPRSMQMMATVATVLGMGLGGTAGGLSVTSLAILGRGMSAALRGREVPRVFFGALLHMFVLAGWIAAVFLALLASDPQVQADRLFTLAAAASSNSALSHDPISMEGGELFLLSLAMVVGRAMPIAAIWTLVYFNRSETPGPKSKR